MAHCPPRWDAPDWQEFPAPFDIYVRDAYRSGDLVYIRAVLNDARAYRAMIDADGPPGTLTPANHNPGAGTEPTVFGRRPNSRLRQTLRLSRLGKRTLVLICVMTIPD